MADENNGDNEEDEDPPVHNGIVNPDPWQMDKWKADQNSGVGSHETFLFLRSRGVPLNEMDNNNPNNPISPKFLKDCIGNSIKKPKQISDCREAIKTGYSEALAAQKCFPEDDECVYGDSDYTCDFSGEMTVDESAQKNAIESGSTQYVKRTFVEVFDKNLTFSGTYSGALPSSERLTSTTQTGGSYKVRWTSEVIATGEITTHTTEYTYVNARFIIGLDGSPTFRGGESGQSGNIGGITGWNNCKKERKLVTSINHKVISFDADEQECPGLSGRQNTSISIPKIVESNGTHTPSDELYSNFTDCNQAFNDQAQKPDTSSIIPTEERIDFDSYHNVMGSAVTAINNLGSYYTEATTDVEDIAWECVHDQIPTVTNGEESNLNNLTADNWQAKDWAGDLVALYELVGLDITRPKGTWATQGDQGSTFGDMKDQHYPSPAPDVGSNYSISSNDPTC